MSNSNYNGINKYIKPLYKIKELLNGHDNTSVFWLPGFTNP